ncbi:hypothetical protein [Eudoraea sp.]|uniref:hypothetical protein n=1 Tax=Eudoraea sp. TaxID=1979955 RepID=UPI003C75501C
MKNLLLAILLLSFVAGCDKEYSSSDSENLLTGVNAKAGKVDICHKGKIINVSSNAVPAHLNHGDAVDIDGDGLFNIDNLCSATDCDDSDAADCNEELSTAELLPGTWTTSEVDIFTSVSGQSIADYLIDVVGFTEEDALDQQALIESYLEEEATGTLKFYEDNTYESFGANGYDFGTWSLSADETTLTLFESNFPDMLIITINSISEDTWNATIGDDLLFDLDNNPATPDVTLTAAANVVLVK